MFFSKMTGAVLGVIIIGSLGPPLAFWTKRALYIDINCFDLSNLFRFILFHCIHGLSPLFISFHRIIPSFDICSCTFILSIFTELSFISFDNLSDPFSFNRFPFLSLDEVLSF